ncbi:MAG: hypothetical protein LQ340_004968, partial [Diploschistes diacapsis]
MGEAAAVVVVVLRARIERSSSSTTTEPRAGAAHPGWSMAELTAELARIHRAEKGEEEEGRK